MVTAMPGPGENIEKAANVVEEAYRNLAASSGSRARAFATCVELAGLLLPELPEQTLLNRVTDWIGAEAHERSAAGHGRCTGTCAQCQVRQARASDVPGGKVSVGHLPASGGVADR